MIAVVVKNVVLEAHSVVRIVLGREDNERLPTFEAGAHIEIHLSSGLVRQYSLCRLQADDRYYEIAVLKDPESRGGSRQVHALKIGDRLSISEPRNHFPLVSLKRKSLLIAGGIGVTPLLPMAQTLAQSGADFEFHYCSKSPDHAAFSSALEVGSFADKMHFHYSQVSSSGRMDVRETLSENLVDVELYVCGPANFITAVLEEAKTLGWPEIRLHREFFSAPAQETTATENTEFTVKIFSTGEAFLVGEDQTISQVLDENGVFLPVSCEEGVCGTCMTQVVDGIPDHRDVFLTDKEHQEGKLVMACCSRSKTKTLTLDL
ncbi:PDR/VanB family oxidoreductase [Marinomonas balearica]|uniref:Vanillate O-demethylase ferredoxin subunit n=1 Tax=Marinomonas balearica TaxID=491947 RepID=A0A4R6M511_9GAMM|nr:PDR/VanB family oxidoreductase [Marinomonas balearica]TDO96407.1 vanillate O-demethylase ferredoxin subunit [Marinomonas balearica]